MKVGFTGCGKTLWCFGDRGIFPGMDSSNQYAWRRSEAGGDVQLFNLGTTDSDGASGAADSCVGRSCAGSHGCRVGEVVLRHRPPVDCPRAAVAGHAFDDSLFDPLGAAVDGADELQPALPLVRGS